MAESVEILKKMDNLLLLQHSEIQATFEKSLGTTKHSRQIPLFTYLCYRVSLFAMDRMLKEVENMFNFECDHLNRTIYGLPCLHELHIPHTEQQPMPLSMIDEH